MLCLITLMTDPTQEQKAMRDSENPDQELDVVDEASIESFPASDPPAWIGGERNATISRLPVGRQDAAGAGKPRCGRSRALVIHSLHLDDFDRCTKGEDL